MREFQVKLLKQEAVNILSAFEAEQEPIEAFLSFDPEMIKALEKDGFIVREGIEFLSITKAGEEVLFDHVCLEPPSSRPQFFKQGVNYQTISGQPIKIEALGSGDGFDGAPYDTFAVGLVDGEYHFWREDGTHFTDATFDVKEVE